MEVGDILTYAKDGLSKAKDFLLAYAGGFMGKLKDLDPVAIVIALVLAVMLPRLMRWLMRWKKSAAQKAAAGEKRLHDAARDGKVDKVSSSKILLGALTSRSPPPLPMSPLAHSQNGR